MEAFENLLKVRYERGNLDVTKHYEKVQNVGGIETITYLGQFVRSYSMGSGDGMTLLLEFNNNGMVTRACDQMWGSISGAELVYFRAVADPST
jgi:hypothetical protein